MSPLGLPTVTLPAPDTVDLTKVYDVLVVGSGAAGGMAAHVLTGARPRRADAGGRPAGRLRGRGPLDGVALPPSAPRQARARHLRAQRDRLQAAQAALCAGPRPLHQRDELAAARRGPGLHQEVLRQREGASLHRHQLLLGALARARRQDQRVGTPCAAALRLRLQGGEPRRLRRRLADRLRRRRALLRQGRPLSRHFRRDRESAVAAGLDLPAPDPAQPGRGAHARRARATRRAGWSRRSASASPPTGSRTTSTARAATAAAPASAASAAATFMRHSIRRPG